jgi:hypothetical protein
LWAREHETLQSLLDAVVAGKHLRKNEPLNKAIEARGVTGMMTRLADGLAGTVSGFAVIADWVVDLATAEGVAKHVKNTGLASFRPQDLDLMQALAQLAPAARRGALEAAFDAIQNSIPTRKREARQFSFADMIELLHGAVTHPERGRVAGLQGS